MPLNYEIYDTGVLLGLFQDPKVAGEPPTFWLDHFRSATVQSDKKYIMWEQVSQDRPLAPLVVPTDQGEPIVEKAARVESITPAYVKPLDSVTPQDTTYRMPGAGELAPAGGMELTPLQRFNRRLTQIVATHNEAVQRRWNWLMAQALLYGQVVLEGRAYPRTIVDFERDPAHTVVLAPGSQWGDAGVSIFDDVERWSDMMATARFGGAPTVMVCGKKAYKAMRADDAVREAMNKNYQDSDANGVNIYRGILPSLDVFYAGRLAPNLQVIVYNETYTDPTGAVVPFMDERDILLVSPAVQGVMAFGAIEDLASLRAMQLFPKMYEEPNPSAVFLLTQSAPLAVPVNPNATLRARVVA